jgi:hypothetical protein
LKLSTIFTLCLLVIISHTSVTQAMDNQQKETYYLKTLAAVASADGFATMCTLPSAVNLLYQATNSAQAIVNDLSTATALSTLIASTGFTAYHVTQGCRSIAHYDNKKAFKHFGYAFLVGLPLTLTSSNFFENSREHYYQNNTN